MENSLKIRQNDYILQLNKITKSFASVIALKDVSFNVRKAKILSLVGENGAGKSTILKIISGVYQKNSYLGSVVYDNKETNFHNVKDSEKQGIAIIHQELSISPYLSICENVFLGNHKNFLGIIDWNWMMREAKKYLDLVGLKNIDLNALAGDLSIADQQLVEIAKALSKNAKLLILDEPTSSLNDRESFMLLDLMKKLRDEHKISCMFVSHKLKEVEYVADDIVVIRDGRFISAYNNETTKISETQLIKDIVGRSLESKFPPHDLNRKIGKTILELKNFKVLRPGSDVLAVKNASLDLKEGEIVGVSGLVGSGRTELFLSMFGNFYGKRLAGEIIYKNKKVEFKHPKDAIKAKIMYASEDRKNLGLIQLFSIHTNIGSASLHLFSNWFHIINDKKLIQNSQVLKNQINIKTNNIFNNLGSLSGGNQQKIVIAKALTTKFDVLIIDEPTKGIDVGSKYEIYKIINELSSMGKSIIVISSELEEILGLSDRIFVMSEGLIKGQISAQDATQEKIMEIALKKIKKS